MSSSSTPRPPHTRLNSTWLDSTRPDPTPLLYLSYTATFCLSGLSGCGRYCVELRFVRRLCRPRVKSSFSLSIVLIPMHLGGGGGDDGGYFIFTFFFLKLSLFFLLSPSSSAKLLLCEIQVQVFSQVLTYPRV